MMANGVCVLFPEMYTEAHGIKELGSREDPSNATNPKNSGSRVENQENLMLEPQKTLKKEKKMEKKKERRRSTAKESVTSTSLFRSEKTSIRQSDQTIELDDHKRDLRL